MTLNSKVNVLRWIDVSSASLALQDAHRAVNRGARTADESQRDTIGLWTSCNPRSFHIALVPHSPGEDEIPSVACAHGVATQFFQGDGNGAVGSASRHEFG